MQDDGKARPKIFHKPGKLPDIIDDTLSAVSHMSVCVDLFVWSGGLYRIYRLPKPETGNIARPVGSLVLHHIDANHLSELATRAAHHYKFDRRSGSWLVIDCPRRIAEAIISRGQWPTLRHLGGIVEAPTITADGRLVDEAGYHPCGLFVTTNPGDYMPPPAVPTLDDAKAAVKQLSEAVETFPFVDDCDSAAAIAAIMTGLNRRSFPAAPMVGITSSTPGTGKSLLGDVICTIVLGRPSAVFALGADENETEKRLYSAFLAGDSILTFDNIEQPLRGAVLCQVLTQSSVRFRPLGGSSVVTVPTCAMLIATGNNLDIRGDLRRRVMLIRLDAKTERPERRVFERDALAYVASRRGTLIRAALTISLAYLAALPPPPEGIVAYGGFSEWDVMVRRPLVWAGLPDPLRGAETLRDTDPDLEATRAMFAAWRSVYGDEATTVADVLACIREDMSRFDGGYDSAHPDLRDAIHAISGERLDARRVGGWLRRHRDRIVDGLQLVQSDSDSHAKVARWRVITAG